MHRLQFLHNSLANRRKKRIEVVIIQASEDFRELLTESVIDLLKISFKPHVLRQGEKSFNLRLMQSMRKLKSGPLEFSHS